MNNVNTSVGNTSMGEQEYTLFGKPTIMESLRGLKFQISANSFFQTNTHQVCKFFLFLYFCLPHVDINTQPGAPIQIEFILCRTL